jgi:hypothetical protein
MIWTVRAQPPDSKSCIIQEYRAMAHSPPIMRACFFWKVFQIDQDKATRHMAGPHVGLTKRDLRFCVQVTAARIFMRRRANRKLPWRP